MDQELFKQRLSEVAEWAQPKITKSDIKEARQRARGRRSPEDKYQEEHEQVFAELFDGINPTVPLELKTVKPALSHCEHCDQMVQGGPHIEKRLYLTRPRAHWRETCKTCNRGRNPYTKQFDVTPAVCGAKWSSYLRNPNHFEQPGPNHADDHCVITFYGRSTEENK
jgi:hypothetical protein